MLCFILILAITHVFCEMTTLLFIWRFIFDGLTAFCKITASVMHLNKAPVNHAQIKERDETSVINLSGL